MIIENLSGDIVSIFAAEAFTRSTQLVVNILVVDGLKSNASRFQCAIFPELLGHASDDRRA